MSARTKILTHCISQILNLKMPSHQKPQKLPRKKNLSLKPISLKEINEISEILEGRLYLSGAAPLTDQKLRNLGITTVICALTEIEEKHVLSPSYANMVIRKIYVRLLDSEHSDLFGYFDPISEIIEDEIRRGGRVLVHCLAGVSRSPTLVMAYLMRYKNYSLIDAYDYVAERRKIIEPNDSFVLQLAKYERTNKDGPARVTKEFPSDQSKNKKSIVEKFPMVTIVEETVTG